MTRALLISLLLSLPAFSGETREWSNAEGTKHFTAEFISREKNIITLKRNDGELINFDITILNAADQRWVNLKYPLNKEKNGEKMPDENAFFDTLKFGDSRDTVTAKLRESKLVETSVEDTFQGRTGLNGIYRTTHKIGGLYCFLYFNWSEEGTLKELTLQTENQEYGKYNSVLKPCWAELSELIVPIHGKPTQAAKLPSADSLQDGQMLASHLWNIESGGTVMLGTARVGNGYQVVVRFLDEAVAVNKVP